VVDAFAVPKPLWDATRNRYYLNGAKPALFPPAAAKAEVLLARLQLVAQRIARNPEFTGRILKTTSGAHAGIQARAPVLSPPACSLTARQQLPALPNPMPRCNLSDRLRRS